MATTVPSVPSCLLCSLLSALCIEGGAGSSGVTLIKLFRGRERKAQLGHINELTTHRLGRFRRALMGIQSKLN